MAQYIDAVVEAVSAEPELDDEDWNPASTHSAKAKRMARRCAKRVRSTITKNKIGQDEASPPARPAAAVGNGLVPGSSGAPMAPSVPSSAQDWLAASPQSQPPVSIDLLDLGDEVPVAFGPAKRTKTGRSAPFQAAGARLSAADAAIQRSSQRLDLEARQAGADAAAAGDATEAAAPSTRLSPVAEPAQSPELPASAEEWPHPIAAFAAKLGEVRSKFEKDREADLQEDVVPLLDERIEWRTWGPGHRPAIVEPPEVVQPARQQSMALASAPAVPSCG